MSSSPDAAKAPNARSVSLVSMPWSLLTAPSIQIGTLQALLEREGLAARAHSFHLELVAFHATLPRGLDAFGVEEYRQVADRWATSGVGEWVFAVPPARAASRAKDERFAGFVRGRGMAKSFWKQLERLRARVPDFLAHCAEEVLSAKPAAVGFTTTYAQTIPSIALAGVLKERAPHLPIVFGGAGCEGEMGAALLAEFDCIDAVVRGEAEAVAPALFRALVEGERVPRLSGLCFREGAERVEVPWAGPWSGSMDELPVPRYDEYFERLARSPLAGRLAPELPFESARGCWWGAKQHCTFCGLNGGTMAFRAKSPERVREELVALAKRHEVLDFTAVDNIVDMGYFTTLLPELAQSGLDLRLFYETKSNLTRAQVRTLRDAGVRAIQPGIESLSSPVLALMKKGVTALQNVRLLKWCAEDGIAVMWNLLHGFPGEPAEEYARMAELVPALVHLPAPRLGALVIDRFSPYHARPADFGLALGAPLPYYELLYDAEGARLARLAYSFEGVRLDGADSAKYVGELGLAIERWNREADANRGALTYRRGPEFLTIVDRRTTLAAAQYTLGRWESELYLACDSGASVPKLAKELGRLDSPPSEDAIHALLEDLVAARLVYEENGRYLSLALPATPRLTASTASAAALRSPAGG